MALLKYLKPAKDHLLNSKGSLQHQFLRAQFKYLKKTNYTVVTAYKYSIRKYPR